MYKNMTRKGLALGAGLALVASGLVAAPAQATETGLLWSAYGQSNEMVGVMGHDFTLRIANPTGITIAAGNTADADGIAAQTAQIDDHIVVTVVPKAGQTATVAYGAANASSGAANNGSGAVTVQLASGGTLSGNTAFNPSGLIGIGAPTNLTTSLQVDVYVVYEDGSRSETERITFLPEEDVSASVTVAPVSVSTSSLKGGNTFSLNGINTENFIVSNGQGANPGANGNATSTNFGTSVTVGGAAATTSAWAYDVLKDAYTFGYTDEIVAGDVIIAKVNLYKASASINANKYFDSTADDAEAKFTVQATDANASLKIGISGTNIVHNSSGTATSLVPAETVLALEGTKSLTFVISAFGGASTTTAAGANLPVTVTLKDDVSPANDLGTTTISSNGKKLDVTGSSTSFTLLTNSAGQVSFTVTADNAKDGESFHIDATNSIGDSIDQTTVRWEKAAYKLIPAVDGNFSIAPKGSVALDYTVINQFGTLAGTDHQIAFTRAAGSGDRDTTAEYANWSYVAPVSATGRASVTIVDNGAAATEGSDTVTATLQKAATAGGAYLAVSGATDTFTLKYENDLSALTATAKANYDGIKNSSGTAIAPIYLETDPLVNYDQRLSTSKTAAEKWSTYNYDADGVVVAGTNSADSQLRVYGTVTTTNGAPVAGVAVKLSAAGLNFADTATVSTMTRAANDSFVVFTDATGSYEAFVRGGVAGNVTIDVDAQGAKSSVALRFESSTGVATGLTLVGPTTVAAGARADFTATVIDKFGKPVSGVSVTFKDNGPGVLNTTSAVSTDAFGEAQATLTTLAAENGVTVVTAYATIAGEIVTKTVSITVGEVKEFIEPKVNVGSFGGKLVVYAQGLDGKTISWKVGGKWGTAVAVGDKLNKFNRPVAKKGVDVSVEIYVDGVLELAKTVTTK